MNGLTRLCGVLLVGAIAGPAFASGDVEPMRSVRVANLDLAPATAERAGRTLWRIEYAALRACGYSSTTLPPFKRAIENSDCYKDAVARAVAQVNNPMLQAAYERTDGPAYAIAE